MPRHHLVISGTGRSGTTFLVQLLTELGLDTGYTSNDSLATLNYSPAVNAGLEHDIRRSDSPYVVKAPQFCDYAAEVYGDPTITVDSLIVPMRDLVDATQSREVAQQRYRRTFSPLRRLINRLRGIRQLAPGGYWDESVRNSADLERLLLEKVYSLMLETAKAGIPIVLLHYPTHVLDVRYAYGKLAPLLPGISWERFATAHQHHSKPELVHNYALPDVPSTLTHEDAGPTRLP